jgi:serine/threonine protein kinase
MTDLASFGQEVGGYRVESLIGTGSLGQLFNAHRTADGRPVALKLFVPNLVGQSGFQARFDSLMQAATGLRHPNIVEIYDSGVVDGRAYVAMELMANGSVAGLLRERAGSLLPLDQAIDLARQAATGLAFAHSRGIVHGDIQPGNLLLARTFSGYSLKVGDFGLTRLSVSSGQTATGAMPGAPAYLAPEQFQAQDPDARSDIYSLGAVLYVLATGRLPFAAATLSEAIAGHVHTAPPPPRTIRPDMPAALESITLRCLAKRPAERFASADELARALSALVAASADDAPTLMPAPPAAQVDMPTFIPPPAPVVNAPTFIPAVPDEDAPTQQAPIDVALPDETLIEPTLVAGPPTPQPDATLIASPTPQPDATLIASPAAPAPSTSPQGGQATQSLILGTPAPGFPAMPPSKPIPQIQMLDAQGTQLRLVDLTGDGVAVGRLPDNDLAIDDDAVSERHAQIDWDGNRVSVTDLGSKNGTFLSGMRLSAQTAQDWEGGKAIQIGPYWLRLVPPALAAAGYSVIGASPVVNPSGAGVALPGTTSTPISQPSVRPPTPYITPSVTPQSQQQNSIGDPTHMGPGGRPPVVIDADPAGVSWIDVALEEETLNLTPGQPTVVRMLLTNRDILVDHFTLALIGAPKTWVVSSALPEYQVLPNKDTPAALTVTVPRTPENYAGTFPVTVQARSKKNPAEAGIAPAQWTVQPFEVLNLDLKPKRATGWRSAHYTAIVKNAGNTGVGYTLGGEDDEQAIDFQFQQDKIFLDPGATARVKLTTRGPLRLFGGSQTRGFTVAVEPVGKKQSQTTIGQFIQRALIPLWLIPLLLMVLGALFLYFNRTPTIAVTQLRPRTPIAAAGTPVTFFWQVANARRVELPERTLIPEGSGRYSYTFADASAIPEDLRLVASNLFGSKVEATLVPLITQTPTFTPSPTSTPTPTTEPPPPTPITPTVPSPIPEPPPPPPPQEPPAPPVTEQPANTPVPLTQVDCGPGTPIAITGSGGPAREPFLLFFNGRPVGGGTVGADGRFVANLLIQKEAPGKYPVEVRQRYGSQRVLALFTYEVTGQGQVTLAGSGTASTIEQLTCIVPAPTRVPVPTQGVIVYP